MNSKRRLAEMIRITITAAVVSLMSILLPSVVWAQDVGTRFKKYERAQIQESSRLSREDRARQTLILYSKCLLKARPGSARKILAAFPYSFDYEKLVNSLLVDDCLEAGELQFTTTLMRGGLYIAMYQRDYSKKMPQFSPEPLDMSVETSEASVAATKEFIAYRRFGECVLAKNPASVHAMLTSKVAYTEETVAFNSLASTYKQCLSGGQNPELSKVFMSGILAEVAYRHVIPKNASKEKSGK
jgi:hypothetical protein